MLNFDCHFKKSMYEQFARIGKAVSSPKRLELLDLLSQGERTVEVLAKEAMTNITNASWHLQVLRAARLVESKKTGLFVTYRLTDKAVSDLFRSMRTLAESHLAEVEQINRRFLAGREGMEPISREALLEGARKGGLIVLDVRPVEEYRAGHIRGAVSIPLKELNQRLSELPRDKVIVAYCRGPYCVLSVGAVQMLHNKGFRAVRLEDDIQEWRSHGLPITVGEER
jgi:rhodanese-related sulfurtransferase